MDWFTELTGFAETTASEVRQKLRVEGETLTSTVNGKSYRCGSLETPSLQELRRRVQTIDYQKGTTEIRELIGDVRKLHCLPNAAGALFQVASQFNLLEMASPGAVPEDGVGIYQYDPTQGPACAIAAGAGTIFRNYFAEVNGEIGQTATNQIDCLADLGIALDNSNNQLWRMQNGYAFATCDGLKKITGRLKTATESELDQLRQLLRIGVQSNTEVTISAERHLVTQAYCSALPVGYSEHPRELWEEFAKLVLDASYEATLCAAILNAEKTGNRTVFLTLIGGGVFKNEIPWILDALKTAAEKYRDAGLDLAIVKRG